MPHSGGNDDFIEALERFLVCDDGDGAALPPMEALEHSGLAAYAADRARGERLRTALLAASARHLAIKAEVRSLLRAWQEARIEALLFKGFHLAEFVYPSPGGRQYSDVDVLVGQRQALRAADVATRLGWREVWHAQRRATAHGLRGGCYHGHEVMQLLHPRLGIQLDVHRRLVHNNHNRLRRCVRQDRITRMTWEMSQRVEWEGVSLRLPHPLDAVLVGLVLNRCWSPEDFELRSHDYLDFRLLVDKYGISRRQLQERAEELGCARTLQLFFGRCDPFRRRCLLSSPSRLDLQRWNLLIASERGNRYLERGWVALGEWPRALLAVVRQLPGVVRALTAVRRSGSAREAARRFEDPPARPRTPKAEEWRRMRQAVHRGLRLLGYGRLLVPPMNDVSDRDLEAIALLVALRLRSCPASLSWRTIGGESYPSLEVEGDPLNVAGTLLGIKAGSAESRQMATRRRAGGQISARS